MIVKKDFLIKLKDFGLNSYESKLWTALLSRGVSTAGELSDIANVPRSRSYDVLESLEKKGFIIMKIGKPIKYIAVQPEEVVERIKKKIDEETIYKRKLLDTMKSAGVLNELNLLFKNGIKMIEPNELSGSLKGRQNSYNHLELLMKEAKDNIILMTTIEGLERKNKSFKKTFKKLNDKGVKIRIAAPISSNSQKIAEELSKVAELRNISHIQARFCVIDNKDFWFMALDDKEVHPTYDLGIWIKTPFFASAMTKMFDSVWKDLKPTKI
ncbi:MAG: hypothetical protein KKE93_02045 [Nanoarchaeota archaeon]|nr:hypothetical protein [Nanoarchaeota archaeon]